MGLLDSLFGGMEGSSKLTPQESFAGILMGASGCDGHIADEEVNSLITCLVRMKLYQRYDGRQYGKTLNKLHGFMKKKGVDALIDSCTATLPKELAKAAFANACDIVLADGIVEPDEKAFIEKLREKLKIESKTAKTIAEVMVIKNRG
ncbi:tellurite resistance TerB family protein [Bremerella sp. T1]|uniref:tellurite resistance TerB family protein n=1 Tax=Bremerella sp. TYQ1 TaxID=3119568 RepID=UPI001CC92359|nr:tellurite resistance TerB family protein [Bremerella volcania]UBM34266.1 tellurite resistance TerB family protein [Bremerella volcania]